MTKPIQQAFPDTMLNYFHVVALCSSSIETLKDYVPFTVSVIMVIEAINTSSLVIIANFVEENGSFEMESNPIS